MKEADKGVAKALFQDADGIIYEIDTNSGQHWSKKDDICRATPDSVLCEQMRPKSMETWEEHYWSGQMKVGKDMVCEIKDN